MRFIPIPVKYEWIERIFGTFIADNFNTISLSLTAVGFLIWVIFGKRSKKRTIKESAPIQSQREFHYCIDEDGHIVPDHSMKHNNPKIQTEEPPIAESYFGQYDRYSDLTDEEMRLAMQIRLNRDQPTYEEWKAAKEKADQEATQK